MNKGASREQIRKADDTLNWSIVWLTATLQESHIFSHNKAGTIQTFFAFLSFFPLQAPESGPHATYSALSQHIHVGRSVKLVMIVLLLSILTFFLLCSAQAFSHVLRCALLACVFLHLCVTTFNNFFVNTSTLQLSSRWCIIKYCTSDWPNIRFRAAFYFL